MNLEPQTRTEGGNNTHVGVVYFEHLGTLRLEAKETY